MAGPRLQLATGRSRHPALQPPSSVELQLASLRRLRALAERWLLAAVFFQLSCRVEESVTPVLAEVVGRPRPEDLKPLNTLDLENLENLKS